MLLDVNNISYIMVIDIIYNYWYYYIIKVIMIVHNQVTNYK